MDGGQTTESKKVARFSQMEEVKPSIGSRKEVRFSSNIESNLDNEPISGLPPVKPVRNKKRRGTFGTLLKKITEAPEGDNAPRKFTIKFIIHAFSDITQNLAVFTLLLTINFLLRMIKNNSPKLPYTLVNNVAIWTASELVIDLFFFFLCLTLYQKWWFMEKIGEIRKEYNNWMKKIKEFLFIGVIGVGFLVFYILFFVVLKVGQETSM